MTEDRAQGARHHDGGNGVDGWLDGVTPVDNTGDNWRQKYGRRLAISDLLALGWVIVGTQIVLFIGSEEPGAGFAHRGLALTLGLPVLMIIAWQGALALADTRSERIVGWGSAEYERVLDASFIVFGSVATVAFVFDVSSVKEFLFLSVPFGLAVLLLERWLWRQWVRLRRKDDEYCARVVLVGSAASVAQIVRELERTPQAGYRVAGACLPHGRVGDVVEGTNTPVVGDVDSILTAITLMSADTVIVTSTDELPPDRVQEISWGLRPGKEHLILAPSMVGIAGPRIHTRPVAGLPLLHVETPQLSPADRFTKRAFDIVVSAAIIAVGSIVLAGLALAVKFTSPGPVLYRSQRIGLRGEPFAMLKFRSMRQGADKELAALLEAQGTADTPLFKVKDDPRITPIGKVLRKYSLDELPQLFNVLGGSMSLVGPRPQIAAEVALYNDSARRRLLTKPGMTGLWQVSGRSSLEWREAVRLDVFYVDNWSLVSDLGIMLRTFKAVVMPGEDAH